MTANQHDVPADLTAIEAALGRMVHRAGTLETVVRFAGEALASTREDRDELAGTTAGRVLSLTEKIAGDSKDVSPEEYAELTAIFAEIRPRLDSRNVYIHGGWVRMGGQLVAFNKKKNVEANAKKDIAADKYRVETRPVAVEELNELSIALLDLSNRVFDWTDAILRRKNPDLYPADANK
ncbi:hypothetical protein [Streptomyces sp. NPDC019224]|uniref:hypothetical protein n=1 Tax=Streptomyces sp. NPDC019224 TaxID=3154484 RepID=UPI0033D4A3D7